MLYLKDVCSEYFTCILDSFKEDNYTYIVIEYLEDYISLDKMYNIKNNKKSFAKLIDNISAALTTLHHLGMSHRDINPNNIIVNPNTLDIKIIDFSTGCMSNEECENNKRKSYMNTSANFINDIKEKKSNLNLSKQADFYALGVIVYHTITGEYPDSNYNTDYIYENDKHYNVLEKYLNNVAEINESIKLDLGYLLEGSKTYINDFSKLEDITNKELYTNMINPFDFYVSEYANKYIIDNDYNYVIELNNIDTLIYKRPSIIPGTTFYTNKELKIGINENYLVFDTNNTKSKDNTINKIIVGENVHYLKYNKYEDEYYSIISNRKKGVKLLYNIVANDLSNQIIFQRNLKINLVNENIDENGILIKTYKIDLIAKIPILTSLDIESIEEYTGMSYKNINNFLRGHNKGSKFTKKLIFQIDDAFKRAPKVETPFYVYRGTGDSSNSGLPYLGISTGYSSTSLTDDQARIFSGKKCCMYKMKLNIGVPYLYLFEISQNKYENEILLPRGIITTLDNTYIDSNGVKNFEVSVSLSDTHFEPIEVFTDNDILNMDAKLFADNYIYLTKTQIQLFIDKNS